MTKKFEKSELDKLDERIIRLQAQVPLDDRASLLEIIFEKFANEADLFSADQFPIDHQDKIEAFDSLNADQTLTQNSDGKLEFSLRSYVASRFWAGDEALINKLIPVMKERYSKHKTDLQEVPDFIAQIEKKGIMVKPVDIQRVLQIIYRVGLLGGYNPVTEGGVKRFKNFGVSPTILRTKTIADRLKQYLTSAATVSSAMTFSTADAPVPASNDNSKALGLGRWEIIKPLGQGGQGAVSLVWNAENMPKTLTNIQDAVAILASGQSLDTKRISARQLAEAIAVFGSGRDPSSLGALKKLHNKDTAAYAKALKRMQSELRALREIKHQHVVRLYDEKLEEGWYVMEYFPGGMLADHRDEFRGDVTRALAAFRDLVEAMKHLHDANLVHRDIKPENIYVRTNGQLVVGDLGLVFFNDGDARVTATYENVGSRDWMPTWASGERQETVTKAFDVFGLGKVLWAMLSGKTRLNLWYFTRPEYDLTKLFPDQPEMVLVNKLLSKCIVEHEQDCLADATALLTEIDELQDVVRRGAQHFNPKALRPCRVCDQGQYQRFDRDASYLGLNKTTDGSEFQVFTCNHCGHVELFRFPERGKPLPGWKA